MTDNENHAMRLRILATSDMHMNLLSFDYYKSTLRFDRGLQALTNSIMSLRCEVEEDGGACLLFDNGDMLQGNPLGDYVARNCPKTDPHPVAEVMNALKFDAMGLGNHDLDFGLDYLAHFARDLNAPLLSANIKLDAGQQFLRPSTILTIKGVRIGVLSVLPHSTAIWAHAHLQGRATFSNMLDSARATAAQLRADGSDIVILLAHAGIGSHAEDDLLEQFAKEKFVDALVGGHTHHMVPNADFVLPGMDPETGHWHGVPTVMPGFAGQALGCIDLIISQDLDGKYQVESSKACLVSAQFNDAVPSVLNAILPAHDATCLALNAEVGSTETPLTSYFAQTRPTEMLALTAAAQASAISREKQNTKWKDTPVLSAVAPPRAGGRSGPNSYTDIPDGPLQLRHIAEFHVFPNTVWAVEMTGADVRDWLEKSAIAWNSPEDLMSEGLFNPEIACFDFDVIYGVTYRIDLSAPHRFTCNGTLRDDTARRISGLKYKGQAIQDDDIFLVTASNYRACGGGAFPGLSPDRAILKTDVPIAEALRDYFLTGEHYEWDTPWSFVENGQATWFDTSPKAQTYLQDIAHLKPGAPCHLDNGFLRIPITV